MVAELMVVEMVKPSSDKTIVASGGRIWFKRRKACR